LLSWCGTPSPLIRRRVGAAALVLLPCLGVSSTLYRHAQVASLTARGSIFFFGIETLGQ
jgi:hypothetical protein